MITISWLFVITVLAAAFAIYDAITRLRGRRGMGALAIAELIAAGLMLLGLFLAIPISTKILAIILEIVLILILVIRGKGKSRVSTITIIALILNTIVVVLALGWVSIPGLK
jgi:hypothetical protein